eukprot:CAMPEP_0202915688 /NCGR_PEP_ID=MMETSP1392-20130828/66329_1 /ASSEMBLY_ACC=CAM_ASM_000868 /TAXON_ID=225041 /ORGANISM="Chlamydomonas chlamydogama, Strain SAG 11-48b" /LENGTH=369 /DNA_ID=CAMNT_0049607809 /DNA_START=380 /DNA_END=1489 /DNA_ORIENTATION=+
MDKRKLIRQRLVVWFFCFTVMGVIWSWMMVLVLVRLNLILAAAMVCYLTYVWTVGFKAAETKSWKPLLKRWKLWRHMQQYFDAKLHKTADLDPKKNYIFAMVPHGIAACSGWINFCTEATGFSDTFPGIDVRCLTLDANFRAPVIREYCLLHGLRSAGRKSMKSILNSGPGSAVMLIPGGAAESLLTAPGTMDLLLTRRKGFVKIALETGASLVPVVAFGENDLFDTHIPSKGSKSEAVMLLLKRWFSFATPLFWGTGVTGGFGLLPRNRPLNTVVGAPIEVPRYDPTQYPNHQQQQPHSAPSASAPSVSVPSVSGPSLSAGSAATLDANLAALIDEYHAKFVAAVQKLYDEHKDKYAVGRVRDLRFVK